MIAKRYGSKLHSVTPNFDARAMNEIGFRRDNEWSEDADEFFSAYEKVETHDLTAAAEGEVQGEAEERLLESLQAQLDAVGQTVGDDAAQWKFRPGMRGGEPIAAWFPYTLIF